jgi:hypothetical protein
MGWILVPDAAVCRLCVCMQVAGGPPNQAGQEAHRDARRLDQCPGDGGDQESTGGALLARRGQRQRQLGLKNLWPCKKFLLLPYSSVILLGTSTELG